MLTLLKTDTTTHQLHLKKYLGLDLHFLFSKTVKLQHQSLTNKELNEGETPQATI